jgi:hypothetical protein
MSIRFNFIHFFTLYTHNMSNKKQNKKETPVLLGLPDGDIEVDNDAYITKLGGLPVGLSSPVLIPQTNPT